jgi:hypothetical protein
LKVLTLVAVFGIACMPSWASLIGASVTGSLTFGGGGTNFFDPASGFVPTGPLNKTFGTTVTIGSPAVEFGFSDGANADTADFDAASLVITDIASTAGSASSAYIFTSAAFTGLSLVKLTDTFTGGVTATLVGTTLTVSAPAFTGIGTHTATFSLAAAGAPEPGAGLLFLAGGAMLATLRLRRGSRA